MDTVLPVSKNETIRSFMNRHMTAIDIIAGIIIALLVMSNVFMYLSYADMKEGVKLRQQKQVIALTNEKILSFSKMFIEKVLKAEGEIDFETRLKLESAVRDLQDEDVFSAWQKFTNSTTEREAQQSVKSLLSVLIEKVQ